ncbi:hypothetical protein [Nostoc sp.]
MLVVTSQKLSDLIEFHQGFFLLNQFSDRQRQISNSPAEAVKHTGKL